MIASLFSDFHGTSWAQSWLYQLPYVGTSFQHDITMEILFWIFAAFALVATIALYFIRPSESYPIFMGTLHTVRIAIGILLLPVILFFIVGHYIGSDFHFLGIHASMWVLILTSVVHLLFFDLIRVIFEGFSGAMTRKSLSMDYLEEHIAKNGNGGIITWSLTNLLFWGILVIIPALSLVIDKIQIEEHTLSLLNYDRWLMGLVSVIGLLGTVLKLPSHFQAGLAEDTITGVKHLFFSLWIIIIFGITIAALVIFIECENPQWATLNTTRQQGLELANLILGFEPIIFFLLVFACDDWIKPQLEATIEHNMEDWS
jgi:hypothetical protein